jgi:hypothetical protein
MTLRPATTADVDFFFALRKQALGPYVDAVWGWDDDVQRAYLHRTLDLTRARVIVADGVDVGRLDVEEHPDEVFLALIELTAEQSESRHRPTPDPDAARRYIRER